MLDTSNIPEEELSKAMHEESMKSWTKYFNNLVSQIDYYRTMEKTYDDYIEKYTPETASSYYDVALRMTIELISIHKEKLKLYEKLVLLFRHRPKEPK